MGTQIYNSNRYGGIGKSYRSTTAAAAALGEPTASAVWRWRQWLSAATTTATATAAVAQAAVHGLSTTEITMTTTNDKEMEKWQRDLGSINKL